MTTPLLTSDPSSVRSPLGKPAHLFVFLEIFSCEGGIQSYVKDVLRAYERAAAVSANPKQRRFFSYGMGATVRIPLIIPITPTYGSVTLNPPLPGGDG